MKVRFWAEPGVKYETLFQADALLEELPEPELDPEPEELEELEAAAALEEEDEEEEEPAGDPAAEDGARVVVPS